jgi:hypothetical protein
MAYRKINRVTGVCSEMGGNGLCSACKEIDNPSCVFYVAEWANARDRSTGNVIESPDLPESSVIGFPHPAK